MPVKKPGGMANLNFSLERQDSFHLSDTGTFSQDSFTFGRNGITQSPISHGEVSNLRVEDLELGKTLGRGNSSRVYVATHTPTGKPLAVKVLQEDVEHSQSSRHQVRPYTRGSLCTHTPGHVWWGVMRCAVSPSYMRKRHVALHHTPAQTPGAR